MHEPSQKAASGANTARLSRTRDSGSGFEWLAIASLLPILAGVLAAVVTGPLALERARVQISLGVAGLAWAVAVWSARRVRSSRALTVAIVAGAVALRLIVWCGEPKLSDDVYRYAWEGGLVAEGASPYAHVPADSALAQHRARWPNVFAQMNNRDVSAAYPPLAQYAFAGVVTAAGGPAKSDGGSVVRWMRLAFGLADLGVLVALFGLLRASGRSDAWAIVWAWSPLVALEYFGSAHFDSLGIFALVAACFLFARASAGAPEPSRIPRAHSDSRSASARLGLVFLAAGALVKWLPIALIPFALRAARGVGVSVARSISIVAFALALGFAPLFFLEGGFAGVFTGLSEYALRWESFRLAFGAIEVPVASFLERDGGWLDSRRVARGVALVLWLGVGVWGWRRRVDPAHAAFLLLGAFLLLTPTLHPWYLTWILPFLALRPSAAWIALAAAAPLLYWPLTEWQARAEWIEPDWLWPAVALPFFVLLTLESVLRARRVRGGSAA